ncbi:MAG TPA: PIN domain-containing protein [Anaerolineae bacterium]|nr:PIN domain-containing protein [Anaerolineae bacterium]HQI86897.1 PIN domain-containing protein [Anaerolineae bacterium]
MALHNLADPTVPLPQQLVIDSSLLLALRSGDDNPYAEAAQAFVRRLRPHIAAFEIAAWVTLSALQECYHIILTRHLRRVWESLDSAVRLPNWLAMYKRQPERLQDGYADLTRFDDLLAAIPLTLVQPEDLKAEGFAEPLPERLRYFITTYHLLPQDAMILAEAERLGVKVVVTLDGDWQRVTEFDVYTVLV